MRLMSEDSVHKDELDELFTVEYVNGLIGQDDQISHTKKTRRRQTPVMTLRAFVGPAHQKNYPSVRGQILHNSKMSELWLRLTADATVGQRSPLTESTCSRCTTVWPCFVAKVKVMPERHGFA